MTTSHLALIVADAHTRRLRCAAEQHRLVTRVADQPRVNR
jgi:hypothetical protein